MGTWSTSGPDSNRRRSQRVILSVPVSVSGQAAKGQFTEDTKTLVVNAHGALITLAAKVSQGQQLELKSVSNPEPQTCKVVYIGPTVQGQTQVGVEFTKPAPHFWHVAFPPENWTPVADEGAAAKMPVAATKPAAQSGTKSPVTAAAKPVSTGTAKPPVPAPVKVSKP
jgi:PilZ domain